MHMPWWSFIWIPGKYKQEDKETQEKSSSNRLVCFHSGFYPLPSVHCSCSLPPSWDVSTVIYLKNNFVWLIKPLGGCSASFTIHIVRTTRKEDLTNYSGQSLSAQKWKEEEKDLSNALTFSVREQRLWAAFPQPTVWCLSLWLIPVLWHNSGSRSCF